MRTCCSLTPAGTFTLPRCASSNTGTLKFRNHTLLLGKCPLAATLVCLNSLVSHTPLVYKHTSVECVYVWTVCFCGAGFLVSLDDFYLLGSGLMMTQTTNNVFNQSLYGAVTPSSLFTWQRVRLANALAHTGEEWAKIFSRFNSGQKTRANAHSLVRSNMAPAQHPCS